MQLTCSCVLVNCSDFTSVPLMILLLYVLVVWCVLPCMQVVTIAYCSRRQERRKIRSGTGSNEIFQHHLMSSSTWPAIWNTSHVCLSSSSLLSVLPAYNVLCCFFHLLSNLNAKLSVYFYMGNLVAGKPGALIIQNIAMLEKNSRCHSSTNWHIIECISFRTGNHYWSKTGTRNDDTLTSFPAMVDWCHKPVCLS